MSKGIFYVSSGDTDKSQGRDVGREGGCGGGTSQWEDILAGMWEREGTGHAGIWGKDISAERSASAKDKHRQ